MAFNSINAKLTKLTDKSYFEYSDSKYRDAVNYNGTNYYNFPITFNHEGVKYVLPFGTSDSKTARAAGNLIYLVAENRGLNYISMCVIDTSLKTTSNVFIDSSDLDCNENVCFGILDLEIEKQIAILSMYLNYQEGD